MYYFFFGETKKQNRMTFDEICGTLRSYSGHYALPHCNKFGCKCLNVQNLTYYRDQDKSVRFFFQNVKNALHIGKSDENGDTKIRCVYTRKNERRKKVSAVNRRKTYKTQTAFNASLQQLNSTQLSTYNDRMFTKSEIFWHVSFIIYENSYTFCTEYNVIKSQFDLIGAWMH